MPASTPVNPAAQGAEASPDLKNIRSGETYLGYQRATGFVSPETVEPGVATDYSVDNPDLNQWGLAGTWTIDPEQAVSNKPDDKIVSRFSARDLHLVLGSGQAGKPIRFQVTIDGKAPGANHGADIDADGYGTVSSTRLYQLIRQSGDVTTRKFEIRFLDPGVEAYAFTFG